jgi:hypothetical protein
MSASAISTRLHGVTPRRTFLGRGFVLSGNSVFQCVRGRLSPSLLQLGPKRAYSSRPMMMMSVSRSTTSMVIAMDMRVIG